MKNSILLFILVLFFSAGYAQKQSLQAEISKETAPALIRETYNKILNIKIHNPSEKEIPLNSITLSLEGTDDLKDISRIQIFCTGISPQFNPQVLFGQTSTAKPEITFQGKQTLQPGNNYFWVSAELTPQAPLAHTLQVNCKKIKADGASVQLGNQEVFPVTRFGYTVRKRFDDKSDTYRIPGLVCTPKGTLLAVYDIRWNNSADLQEDIDVGVSRSLDNGQSWLPMQKAIDLGEWGGKSDQENGVGDPAILVDEQTGRIWVAALWLHSNKGKRAWWASKPGITPQETGQFVLAYSDDEGASWSDPINITDQIKNPEWYLCFNGPGMGITMKNGTLVFAAQFKDKDQIPHSTIVYSKDHGKTWHIGTGAKSKTTESQVVELADGSLMLNMRDDRGGSRSIAVTQDFGKTWEEHPTSRKALQEPVCQASIIRFHLKDGRSGLAFFNPNTQRGRHHLTLKLSFDEGQTWPEKYHTLVYEPGSFGYSCLTQIQPGLLGVLYEGAGDLYFQQLDLEKIVQTAEE